MPNYYSIDNKWFTCPDDNAKFLDAQTRCKDNISNYHSASGHFPSATTNADIITQINNADSTFSSKQCLFDGKTER